MAPEILQALLWLVRASVRCGRRPVGAAHGYADSAHRPPRVPYASIIGPLTVDIEPVRDARIKPHALVQAPGYVTGDPIDAEGDIPSGTLTLRFDGTATFPLTGLGGSGVEPADVAPQIEAAVRDMVEDGGVLDGAGEPLVLDPVKDKERRDELLQITCRWDPESGRIAIASGRRGFVKAAERSTVEILTSAGSIVGALGLATAHPVAGRLQHHELPVPRAMMVDVRADFWAATQGELASMADSVARLIPGRGSMVTRPALLAADLGDGAVAIPMLAEGEPATRYSLAHVEGGDIDPSGTPLIVDRISNRSFTKGGSVARAAGRIELGAGTPSASLSLTVCPTPLVPSPLDAAHPAPRGAAVSIGVAFQDAESGQTVRLVSLDFEGAPVLRLALGIELAGSDLMARIVGSSTFVSGSGSSLAKTEWLVPVTVFADGATVHAAVDASTGIVDLFLDGLPAPKAALDATGSPEVALGAFAAGNDMSLVIGEAANPVALRVGHVHVFSEPLGAFDARLRRTLTPTRMLTPGMRLTLAESEDGVRPGTRRAETMILSVDTSTGTLTVSPPIAGAFLRGRTIAFGEEQFVQQMSLRRRDDLFNNLHRFTVDYRISTLLEDDVVPSPVPAVETTQAVATTLSANTPAGRVPGVDVEIV